MYDPQSGQCKDGSTTCELKQYKKPDVAECQECQEGCMIYINKSFFVKVVSVRMLRIVQNANRVISYNLINLVDYARNVTQFVRVARGQRNSVHSALFLSNIFTWGSAQMFVPLAIIKMQKLEPVRYVLQTVDNVPQLISVMNAGNKVQLMFQHAIVL